MSKVLFLEYPKCTTCQKARKFLQENGIEFEDRNIVENNPSAEELRLWIKRSGKDIKKFFNTSGMLYKEKGLSKKLMDMTFEEKISELSASGMLVKRPLIVTQETVLIGFKESEWNEVLK